VTTFTHLEKCVLDAICAEHRDTIPHLAEYLSAAEFMCRNNTGHGFYTRFRSAASDADPNWPRPVEGPHAYMIGMGVDAIVGFLLWCCEGKPSSLEGFQYGDSTGRTVDLRTWDLSTLQFHRLEWDREVDWFNPKT
jgi:hypothetical protein